MPESISYNVNAWLRMRGNFAQQMTRSSAAVLPMQRRLDAMGRTTQQWGRTMMGTTAQTAAGMTKVGVAVAGLGLAAAFGAALKVGSDFNAQMETTELSIAAMFQLYDKNQGDFTKNLGMAKGAMKDLFEMTKKSPVEFQEGVDIYQGAAAGLIVANQSMQEQMEFMKGAQMLGAIVPDLDAKTIGGQLGRIILGGAGAEFEVWKRMAPAILKAGQASGVFAKNMNMGQKFTQEFNKLAQESPEIAMELLKKGVKPLADLADVYERSWTGILSTTKSNLRVLAGRFAGPLHEARKNLMFELNKTGFMGDENLAKLERIAATMGIMLAGAGEEMFRKMVAGAEFIQENWKEILQAGRDAATIAAAAIKGAFFIGVTRMVAGAAMVGAGGMMRGGAKGLAMARGAGGFFGQQRKAVHTGIARGMAGRGRGMTGMMGRGAAGLFGKLGAAGGQFRELDKWVLGMTSMATVAVGGAAMFGVLAVALGSVIVIVGGLAAYLVDNWAAISSSIVQGLNDGTVSLMPFMTALYTLWAQLTIVGEAFLGASTGAGMMNGMLSIFTTMAEMAGGAIGFFMKAIGISIGIWGALKLAFQGVMVVVMGLIKVMHSMGAVSDETLSRAEKNMQGFSKGTQDTFTSADRLMTKADEIANVKLDRLDLDRAEKDAKAWEERLSKALGGDDPAKKRKPRGPKVSIGQVTVIQDLRDTDPDRLMAAFIRPLEQMADQRVQAYDQLDQGI